MMNRKAPLLTSIGAALVAGLIMPVMAMAATSDSRNVIKSIDGHQVAGEVVLKIEGSKAPSFTSYRLENPARVVIDLGDAVLAGPASEIPIGLPSLPTVRTLMYEANGVSFARVVLETGVDRATKVDAEGSTLMIRVASADDGRALARRSNMDAVEAAKRVKVAESKLSEAQAKAAFLESEAARWQEQAASSAQALEAAKSEATVAAYRTKEETTAVAAANQELERRKHDLARAEAALTLAQAENLRSREAAASQLAEERARGAEAILEAKSQAELSLSQSAHERDVAMARAQAARLRLEEAETSLNAARAEVASLQTEVIKVRETADQRSLAEKRAREEAESLARNESAARRTLEAELDRLRKNGAFAMDGGHGLSPGARYAYADAEDGAGGENAGVPVDNRPKLMSMVGFQQRSDVSRVYVRTNEPARYSVSEQGKEIWLELENTRAATMNDLNHLDTRFFDTAVETVDPEEIGGAGTHIRVRIRMKTNVPYEVTRSGNEIRVDFRRQAGQ